MFNRNFHQEMSKQKDDDDDNENKPEGFSMQL